EFKSHMAKLQKGASYPAVTDGEIKAQSLAIPPLGEQRRIIRIIDEAFNGIASAKANVQRNLQNVRDLFQSQLESVFSAAWTSCDVGELSDLATDITDGDHLPPPKSSTGVPFITISNINKETRRIDFSDTFLVPR